MHEAKPPRVTKSDDGIYTHPPSIATPQPHPYIHSINLNHLSYRRTHRPKPLRYTATRRMFSTRHEQHHVVHIGGAEFVPPMMTHFAHVPNLSLSTSPSSEASSSAASSPVHSRFSSSSTASSAADSLEEWDAVQAHLAYARRMADHTASMWQKERLAIEKAKLDEPTRET